MDKESDFEFDKTEYENWRLTSDQYEYIADRVKELVGDSSDNIKKYRMLLVELEEKEVERILGATLVYGSSPAYELFWNLVEDAREERKLK